MITKKRCGLVPLLLWGVCALGVCVAVPSPAGAQSRAFTAEDMLGLVQISGRVSLAASGDRIAYMLPDPREEWNILERLPLGTVYMQRLEGPSAGPPVPLGSDGQRSSFPVFSPDGSRLAFFIGEAGGTRLAVWRADTGETRSIGAPFRGKATMPPQWASDARVVYARPAASIDVGERTRVRVLQSTDEVLPGDAFFANKSRAGLVVVDVVTGAGRTLLEDDAPLRRFDVSPDGEHVIAVQPSPATMGIARREQSETFLWRLDAGGAPRKITGRGERMSWLPDGRLVWRSGGRLLTLGANDRGPAEGGSAVPFMPGLGAQFTPLTWSPDGTSFVSLVADPSITDPEIEAPQPGMYTIARPFTDLYLVSSVDGTERHGRLRRAGERSGLER